MVDRREPESQAASSVDSLREPSAAEVRAALERILASQCFTRAGRASELLRFLVGQTLAGVGPRLKGYTIGVQVFGRPADFDPQADPLVRVEAGRLRRRLLEYYSGEGSADPVRIELPRGSYSVVCRYARSGDAPNASAAAPRRRERLGWHTAAALLGVAFIAALGVIVWQQRALVEAGRALEVLGEPQATEWPRIVVVPFENLSDQPRLDHLAASMTEEIMVVLSQLDLFVVATQTSWYGPEAGEGAVAMSAAGGYVLTGSVRGGGEQARITVRLIEAESGTQLWTSAYDEPLAIEGLPALQERVAREVAAVAAPYGPIFEAELARARRVEHSPELRDCLVEYYDYRRRIDAATHRDAFLCFKSLSERKPQIARVWAGLAMLHLDEFGFRTGREPGQTLAAARADTAKALALDPDDFQANLALSRLQFFDRDPKFRQSIERTVTLRPDSTEALSQGGLLLVMSGDSAAGLPFIERARVLSKGQVVTYHFAHALTYLREGFVDEALAEALRVDAPNWIAAQVIVAAAAGLSGREDVARGAVRHIVESYPEFEQTAREDLRRWRFDTEYEGRILVGLRAAGLKIAD